MGVVAWATRSNVKLKDLEYGKRIGIIERPPILEGVPDKQIKEYNSSPCIIFELKDTNISTFAIAWINVLKIYELRRDPDMVKVSINKMHQLELDPMTRYISGFCFIDENFLLFEFEDNKDNSDNIYEPQVAVYSEQNKQLFRNTIKSSLS